MEMIRVLGFDPNEIDIFSDEKEEEINSPKRKICQINPEPEPIRSESPKSDEKYVSDPIRNPRNPYLGVYLRRSGKWVSEIRDPATYKRFHLGTFDSSEAAHEAYCAKKLELSEKSAPEKVNKPKSPYKRVNPDRVDESGCDLVGLDSPEAAYDKEAAPKKINSSKNPYKGVSIHNGWWRYDFRYEGSRYYLSRFETAEAAYEACCARKREVEEKAELKKKDKAEPDEDADSVYEIWVGKRAKSGKSAAPRRNPKGRSQKSDSGYVFGKPIRLTDKSESCCTKPPVLVGTFGTLKSHFNTSKVKSEPRDLKACHEQAPSLNGKSGFEEKAGFETGKGLDFGCGPIPREIGSHIVDENGFLLGEFGQIDDMTIC